MLYNLRCQPVRRGRMVNTVGRGVIVWTAPRVTPRPGSVNVNEDSLETVVKQVRRIEPLTLENYCTGEISSADSTWACKLPFSVWKFKYPLWFRKPNHPPPPVRGFWNEVTSCNLLLSNTCNHKSKIFFVAITQRQDMIAKNISIKNSLYMYVFCVKLIYHEYVSCLFS